MPLLEPSDLPKVCHGKPFLPAGDSLKLDWENESDLPRAPLCTPPPPVPANSFCLSGHLPKHPFAASRCLFSTLVLLPPLQDGTQLTTFFSVLLSPGFCDLLSDSSPYLTALPDYSFCSRFSKDLSLTLYPLVVSTLQPLESSPISDLPPPTPPSFSRPQFLMPAWCLESLWILRIQYVQRWAATFCRARPREVLTSRPDEGHSIWEAHLSCSFMVNNPHWGLGEGGWLCVSYLHPLSRQTGSQGFQNRWAALGRWLKTPTQVQGWTSCTLGLPLCMDAVSGNLHLQRGPQKRGKACLHIWGACCLVSRFMQQPLNEKDPVYPLRTSKKFISLKYERW